MLISAELKGCRGVLHVYMFFGNILNCTNCSLNPIFQSFPFDACDRTRTRQHTRH